VPIFAPIVWLWTRRRVRSAGFGLLSAAGLVNTAVKGVKRG
jgi:hypothetical protein